MNLTLGIRKHLLLSLTLWGLTGVVAQADGLPNIPVGLEAMRGRVWVGQECCNWRWTWTQVAGPRFRGEFQNPNGQRLQDNDITINIYGDSVEIIRSGGSSMGGCTYTGKIRVGAAGGNYSCAGRNAGQWSAFINQ